MWCIVSGERWKRWLSCCALGDLIWLKRKVAEEGQKDSIL